MLDVRVAGDAEMAGVRAGCVVIGALDFADLVGAEVAGGGIAQVVELGMYRIDGAIDDFRGHGSSVRRAGASFPGFVPLDEIRS